MRYMCIGKNPWAARLPVDILQQLPQSRVFLSMNVGRESPDLVSRRLQEAMLDLRDDRNLEDRSDDVAIALQGQVRKLP